MKAKFTILTPAQQIKASEENKLQEEAKEIQAKLSKV